MKSAEVRVLTEHEARVLIIHEIAPSPSISNICTLMRVCFSKQCTHEEVRALCEELSWYEFLELSSSTTQTYIITTKGRVAVRHTKKVTRRRGIHFTDYINTSHLTV